MPKGCKGKKNIYICGYLKWDSHLGIKHVRRFSTYNVTRDVPSLSARTSVSLIDISKLKAIQSFNYNRLCFEYVTY